MTAGGGESSHDASKEVSDILGRRRQDQQNAGRGFRLKLPGTPAGQPSTKEAACSQQKM